MEFNRMAARLQESYAGLEHQVRERTRELASALSRLDELTRDLEAGHAPVLVLMDIRLRDMYGVDALSRLRMDERTTSTPVVAVTAVQWGSADGGRRRRYC